MGWSLARPIASRPTTIATVPGLSAALAAKLDGNSLLDGGTYSGVTAVAGGITITSHPQDLSSSSFGTTLANASVPAGRPGNTEESWQRGVQFAGGKYFLGGTPFGIQDPILAYSDNGLAWTQTTIPFSGSGIYTRVASSGSAYVACDDWGGGVYRSATGATWTLSSGFPSGAFLTGQSDNRAFSGGGKVWVQRRAGTGGAGQTFGRTLYSSTDGNTWSTISLPACTSSGNFDSAKLGALTGVYEANSRLFATFRGSGTGVTSSPSALYTSSNSGDTWSSVGTIDNLQSQTSGVSYGPVVYSQSRWWAAVGPVGVLTSTNGTAWAAQTSPMSYTPTSIAASSNVVLTYGNTSTPLRSWIHGVEYGAAVSIPGMTFGSSGGVARIDGRFVVFSTGTKFAVSTDGSSWQVFTLPYPPNSFPMQPADGGTALVLAALNASTSAIERTVRLTFSAGGAAQFIVAATATGGVPVSYQWQVAAAGSSAWNDINLANASTLTLSPVTTADTGKKYRCIVSASGYQSVTSNPATLTVL